MVDAGGGVRYGDDRGGALVISALDNATRTKQHLVGILARGTAPKVNNNVDYFIFWGVTKRRNMVPCLSLCPELYDFWVVVFLFCQFICFSTYMYLLCST